MKMLVTNIHTPKVFILMVFTALGCSNLDRYSHKNEMKPSFSAAKQKFAENALKLAMYAEQGLKKEEGNIFSRNTLMLEIALRHHAYNFYQMFHEDQSCSYYAEQVIITHPIIALRMTKVKNNFFREILSFVITNYQKGYKGNYFNVNIESTVKSVTLGAASDGASFEALKPSGGPTFNNLLSAQPAIALILLYIGADQSWANLKLVGNKQLNEIMKSYSKEDKIQESLKNILDYDMLFEILKGYKGEGRGQDFCEFMKILDTTRLVFHTHPKLLKIYIEGEKTSSFAMQTLRDFVFGGTKKAELDELMKKANNLDKDRGIKNSRYLI